MLPISFIEIQNQILGAAVGINGTPFSLNYSSDRTPGRQAAYTRTIPVSGSHVAAELERIEIEIDIAGQHFIKTFPPQPNQTHTFIWDGKDITGRLLSGKQPVRIYTTFIYPNPEHNQRKEGTSTLGTWNAIAQGLGAWTLNIHHAYDVAGKTLYFGNGQRRNNVEAIAHSVASINARRGLKPPSHSESRLKPTEDNSSSSGDIRQGINSLSNSESRLKPTEDNSSSSVHFSGLELLDGGFNPRRDDNEAHNPRQDDNEAHNPRLDNNEANNNQTNEIAIPSEGGGQLYIFDNTGRHLYTISTLTQALIYCFEYDDAGYLKSIADGDNNITQIDRNADGTPIAIIAPYGQRTKLNFNANGYLESVTNPANESSAFNYINHGLLTSFTDPKGNLYQFEYDELGRLKSRQEPDGSFDLLARTRTKNGFTVAKITATGRESTYLTERLSTGEERQVNKGCGGTGAIIALTGKDGTETITYPDGSTFIQEQQPDPRFGKQASLLKRTVLKTPGGLTANLSLTRDCNLADPNDPLSLISLTDTVDFNGRKSTTTFDAENQQIIYESPAGRRSILNLDEGGRVIKTETAGLESVSFNYDRRGRLISAMQGNQTILNYSYDEQGRLSSLGNAEGNQVQYNYDEVGRIIQTTLPSGRTYNFAYDANSNLTQIIVPNGAVHCLNYTPGNLEAGYVPPAIDPNPPNPPLLRGGYEQNLSNSPLVNEDNSSNSPLVNEENPSNSNSPLSKGGGGGYSSTYDSEQQLTNSTLPSGRTVQGIYNQSGDLERATYPEATVDVTYEKESKRVTKLVRTPANGDTPQEMTFTYDGGLVTEMAWSGVANGTYRYRYDNNFSLVGMQLDDEPEIEMKRDADGLLTQYGQFQVVRNLATGATTQITDGKMNVDIEYDNSGRVISRTNLVNGRVIYQLQLSYDVLSRIIQKRETVTGTTLMYDYTYDLDGQLILVKRDGELVERYVYDDNGNRTEWQLGTQQHTASYDAQDRLIELDGTPYEFDADGFLIQRGDMTLKYSATGELLEVSWPDGKAINYTYDSMNRRVARTDEKGTVQYLYGNPNHPFQVTAVRDNLGKLSVYEYDDFGSLLAIRRGASWYGVTTDQLGTPRVVFDKSDRVVKVLKFDSFGQIIGDSNPEFELPISFAGGLIESDTKLVRFGFRDYDSVAGKWTAKDPIGFAGGDANLYGYVFNDSVNFIDPDGRNPLELADILAETAIGAGTAFAGELFKQWGTYNKTGNFDGWAVFRSPFVGALGGFVVGLLPGVHPIMAGAAGAAASGYVDSLLTPSPEPSITASDLGSSIGSSLGRELGSKCVADLQQSSGSATKPVGSGTQPIRKQTRACIDVWNGTQFIKQCF
ncbi:RHS repeat-associated core domain-containing protein [Microcoleus anatoxicus]|uniref:RHS repeat-associated core domain-containing protein n=1 Tax=Microcoleus anatoxicus PTRS2 TaxID=2705321 RepID=A0ABU8YND6_9CYAN